MDGAALASVAISQHKARVAARYRRPTHAFEDVVQKFGFDYILTLDDVIALRGGIPLIEGGKIIGAIGCSSGTGSQDEANLHCRRQYKQQVALASDISYLEQWFNHTRSSAGPLCVIESIFIVAPIMSRRRGRRGRRNGD